MRRSRSSTRMTTTVLQGFRLVYDYLSTHADGDRYAWAMVGFLLGNTVSANGSVSRGVCVTDAQHNLVA